MAAKGKLKNRPAFYKRVEQILLDRGELEKGILDMLEKLHWERTPTDSNDFKNMETKIAWQFILSEKEYWQNRPEWELKDGVAVMFKLSNAMEESMLNLIPKNSDKHIIDMLKHCIANIDWPMIVMCLRFYDRS